MQRGPRIKHGIPNYFKFLELKPTLDFQPIKHNFDKLTQVYQNEKKLDSEAYKVIKNAFLYLSDEKQRHYCYKAYKEVKRPVIAEAKKDAPKNFSLSK